MGTNRERPGSGSRTHGSRLLLLCLTVCLALLALPSGAALAGPDNADRPDAVWGQPDFTSGKCRHASTITLCGPTQVVPDAQGNLWVADFANNRVLMYPRGSTVASKVFGQYGSFRTSGCDQRPPRGSKYPPAPSRYTLCQPIGLAVDPQGTLYVSDSINNRILLYFHAARKPADAPADRVLGQSSMSSTASNDVHAGGSGSFACPTPHPASACTLNGPMELSLDAGGDLLVPDFDNHRVLLWSAAMLAHLESSACARRCFIPAMRVWGQYGSFAANIADNATIPAGSPGRCTEITIVTPASACTLSGPWAALADAQGNLFIADTGNNRVLEYGGALETDRQDATMVYGQAGNFASARGNLGGVSASSVWHPLGLAIDPGGNLWVTDFYNMRVLEFSLAGSTRSDLAIRVLGQRGQFSSNTCGVRKWALCGPTSIAFDQAGHAFVADGFNSRLLEFF